MTWTMPAETAPLERVWMAFPVPGPSLETDSDAEFDAAIDAWTAVAHAAAAFVPVTMVVDPSMLERAKRTLSGDVELLAAPLDDCWMRDIGPTFVLDPDRPGALGAVGWTFNGWGAQSWARWERDRLIGRLVAEHADAELVTSDLVNEGGAIHTDGEGTVLATETVQLDPGRNPGLDRADVEAELARTIGARRVLWLARGLARDTEELGTRGHVDMVACLPSPGRMLFHRQDDAAHPDHAIASALRASFEAETDARGRSFEIVDLPAPAIRCDDRGFVDYSYVNHLVVDGAVIACRYGDAAADDRAAGILAEEYPGRRVVTVDAHPILAGGGGIHCITQNQPHT